jgi:hypothetical protein
MAKLSEAERARRATALAATGDPGTSASDTSASDTSASDTSATGDPGTSASDTSASDTSATGDHEPLDSNGEPISWASLTTMQRAGKRAAQTRAANKAVHGGSAKPASGKAGIRLGERSAGGNVELWIKQESDRVTLSFLPVRDGQFWPGALSPQEAGLWQFRWIATPEFDSDELEGFDKTRIYLQGATSDELRRYLPLMERIDSILASAREESEDMSLGQVAATLAATFQVSCVKVRNLDHTIREHKRGAAYVMALRASDELIARRESKLAAE